MRARPDIVALALSGLLAGCKFSKELVPTTVDDTLAPAGKHVVNLFGGHAPYELKGASWETERPAFLRNVYDTIDELADVRQALQQAGRLHR